MAPGVIARVDDEAAFFREPVGRTLVADGIAYWCARVDLWGVTFWGVADDAVARRLVRWIELEHEHTYPPYDTLLDFRGTTGIEPSAFALFARWYATTRARQARRVRRAVIVRPAAGGLVASVLAGAAEVLRPLLPSVSFDALPAALRALDRDDAEALTDELDALYRAASAPRASLEALRGALAPPLADLTLAAAAARLGVSARTLQRRLRSAGTTFEAELHAARVRHAQRLLLETDLKLAAVAREAGFATEPHFHAVFQRVTGESPGRWRSRMRRDAG